MKTSKKRSPWAWVPTLYFAEGLPYVAVTLISIQIYMQMGLSDSEVTFYTSWFYLPWVIKPLWSPFLDIIKTKRWWIVVMQLLLGAAFGGVAFTIETSWWLQGTICFFWLLAFSSATHDVGADGFYMLGLEQQEQAFFVGIRSTFYRISMIVGKGGLIALAGVMQKSYDVQLSWALIFYGLMAYFIGFALYHAYILPSPSEDVEKNDYTAKNILQEFTSTFVTFFKKHNIFVSIAFLLLFRFPEALLTPVSPLFLQGEHSKGGLALSIEEFGLINGSVGVIGLLLGGIIGGVCISKGGLKKWLWPMALALTIPNIAYVYLAFCLPENLWFIGSAIFVENFGYGFGFSAYMLYMIFISQGSHKTSHYALCTGFMALSMMLPGLFSGKLAEWVGYDVFYIIVMLSGMFTFLVTYFISVDENFGKQK